MRLIYFSRNYTSHDHRFLSALTANAADREDLGYQPSLEVYYLTLERGNYLQEQRPIPAEVEILSWKKGENSIWWSDGAGLLWELKRLIGSIQPDLILAGPIQRSAFLVALSGFQPLVSMSWGYDLLLDARRNSTWAWATRYTLRRSAALVGDCQTIRDLAISYGMDAERIVTFPWGVDLDHFKPAGMTPSFAHSQPFTLLSVRGWEPIYGVDVIARAFVKAASARPELRLVMLGNGSQAGRLRQILGQTINADTEHPGWTNQSPDNGYPPKGHSAHRVLFPGLIGFNELPRYYRSADLVLSASHSDGSSISLLEAMACGCPVLVSDIPGNREWVQPGVNGWLFPDGDADALAEAILHALDQRSRLPEMGRQARQVAEQRADWQKNFPNLFRAIEIAFEHTNG